MGVRRPKPTFWSALAEAAELFQTPDEIAYADIEVDGHRETWPIKSRGFRRWLKRRYFEEFGGAPNGEAVASALGVIEAKAQHDTPVREVFVRVGELDGKIYLDLCDPEWRAVEIDKTGWRVIDRPDVRFRRSPDMRPLPEPETRRLGRGPAAIAQIIAARASDGDDDFILAVAFVLACLRAAWPLSGHGDRRRAGQREIDPLGDVAQRGRSATSKIARPAARRAGSGGRGAQSARAGVRQYIRPAGRGCRTRSAASPPGPASAPANSTPMRKRSCSPALGRSFSTASRRSSSGRTSPNARHSPPASRSAPRTGSRRKRSGRPSTLRTRLSSAPCSMRWRRASSAFPRSARRTCRAWPTSPTG